MCEQSATGAVVAAVVAAASTYLTFFNVESQDAVLRIYQNVVSTSI